MFAEEKVLWLGQTVSDLKRENEELQARVVLSTSPELVAQERSKIEDAEAEIEELEKYSHSIIEATTQFWMSMVQDNQL